MEAGGLVWTRPSGPGLALQLGQAFWAAGDTAFASPSPSPSPSQASAQAQAHLSSFPAMRLLMLLDKAYLLFSTTFNTLCVGAALVWLDSSFPDLLHPDVLFFISPSSSSIQKHVLTPTGSHTAPI